MTVEPFYFIYTNFKFLDTSFKKSLLLKQHKILSYNSEYTEQFTKNEASRVVAKAHIASYSHIETNLDT